MNVSRACFVVATDPENETRRVLAPFKWNLNAPRPPSIAWTMEPIPPDLVATILAGCDHLSDEDKGKLATQLHRLAWAGKVDADADDLLRAAARSERKSHQNEVDRATEWLRQRLADGPVGSVLCAREGDKAMGRPWPAPDSSHTQDEVQRRVLGRVKWWRETILKKRLEGETARAGYNGPYFFRLPDHITRGLWPPTSEAIRAAQQADDSETRPAPPEDEPWSAPVEAVEAVEAVEETGRAQDSTVDSTGGEASRPSDGDEQPRPVEARRRSRRNKGNSTASTDSTVHRGTEQTTEQAENASTDSTGSLGEAEDQPETELLFCDDDGEYF